MEGVSRVGGGEEAGRTLRLVAYEDDVLEAFGFEIFVEVRTVKTTTQG